MEAICKADFDARLKSNLEAKKALGKSKKEKTSTEGIIVPDVGYHDFYGVWFFGLLKSIITLIGTENFGVDLKNSMHAYVDMEPKKISEAVHDITVYGHSCRLYKWMAQGYNRGLIVLVDDDAGNRNAEMYRRSGTWSWIL